MAEEAEGVWQIAKELNIDIRTAAYVRALKRLGTAMDAKGNRDYFTS